ncbi:hypothetical protein HD554DRAFT_2165781 [Boletus coccyginus]|nr:hypothetical protein HD554DRAFT_2165781 [Boletus coccyginus]
MPDLASALSVTGLTPHGHAENEGEYADRGPDRLLVPGPEEMELDRILLLSQMEDRATLMSIADARSLYDALSTRKGSPGQLRMVDCRVTKYGPSAGLDMVGMWEGGRFHVVEESDQRQ